MVEQSRRDLRRNFNDIVHYDPDAAWRTGTAFAGASLLGMTVRSSAVAGTAYITCDRLLGLAASTVRICHHAQNWRLR